MHYYSSLLASAFSAITNQSAPRSLSLLPSADKLASNSARQTSGQFEFPSSFLPPSTEILSLFDGESFFDNALLAAENSVAKCLFVLPPSINITQLSDKWRERFGNSSIVEALVQNLIGSTESTNHIEVLAVLVPAHFLTSSGSSSWRCNFFPSHSAVIIEHNHNQVTQNSSLHDSAPFNFSTVIFQRQPGPLRFFKITAEAQAENPGRLASDFKSLLCQPAGKTRYGYIFQGPLDEAYPCSYDYYSEETKKLRQEIPKLGERVTLASVADIFGGSIWRNPKHSSQNQDGTTAFSISARDITRDGRVDLSDLKTQTRSSGNFRYLEDGDLCIRRIYQPDRGFVVGIYEGDGRSISFRDDVIVVRPRAHLNPAQRQVLLSFLRSPIAHRLGNAKLSYPLGENYTVTPKLLQDFPVPLADEELVSTIKQLNEAKAAFSRWIKHIEEESDAIIMETKAARSRHRLLQAGQLARQRHRAGEQVETLDYRIRTQFPFPIAYVWRELQVAGPDRYHRLRAITKAAEGHTCFLALVAILMSRAIQQPIKYLAEIGRRLSQRKSGTNFGDWISIIKEVNASNRFREPSQVFPFADISQICEGKIWEPAVMQLMRLRNDDSHGRIAPNNVSISLLAEAETALETIFRASEFLTDYQLIFITQTRFDSIQQINRYQYRDLTGDNSLAQLRHDEVRRSDLETGSLYLRDRERNLHLFRPLLQYLECPDCHQMSTFYLDTYDSKSNEGVVGLKSFERNSVRNEPIADEFRHVGILPQDT